MRLALLLAALAMLTGCGAESERAAPPHYELTIEYWPEGRTGESAIATLSCPPGGTHPNPEAACDALVSHFGAIRPVPQDVACTEIYGGPEEATLSGSVPALGPVHASFNRSNGCQIDRWDRLSAVLVLEET
jgi:Subtilisin inhibitor-like